MKGTFNVWSWEKIGPILQQPQVWGGNECLVIGNWIAHENEYHHGDGVQRSC
jgi:hypothetical protein